MGLISKGKVKTPTDKDYLVVAAYTDVQEVLKPQPKMQANLVNIGALKKYIGTGMQGPTGATGATGPTPWNLPATVYNNGLDYNYGDAVIYEGGYYYRTGNPNNPGYPPTPGIINESWTPVADRGEQGIQGIQGIQGTAGASVTILGSYADLAAFNAGAGSLPGVNLGDAWILLSDGSLMSWNGTVWFDAGDIQGPQGIEGPQGLQGIQGIQGIQGVSGTSGLETSTRYSPTFQATGMTFTGTGATYPTYNSYYVKSGLLVSFVIEIDFTTVTNFGTGQYKVALPFAPAFGYNHFSGWIWADPNISPDTGTGHTILNADTAGITTVLDLHYLKQSGGANSPIREGLWTQGLPVPLTTISKAYINGTYISAT